MGGSLASSEDSAWDACTHMRVSALLLQPAGRAAGSDSTGTA